MESNTTLDERRLAPNSREEIGSAGGSILRRQGTKAFHHIPVSATKSNGVDALQIDGMEPVQLQMSSSGISQFTLIAYQQAF